MNSKGITHLQLMNSVINCRITSSWRICNCAKLYLSTKDAESSFILFDFKCWWVCLFCKRWCIINKFGYELNCKCTLTMYCSHPSKHSSVLSVFSGYVGQACYIGANNFVTTLHLFIVCFELTLIYICFIRLSKILSKTV